VAVRHPPRCAICGAPTRLKELRGVRSLECVSCGALTVDQRGVAQLVGELAPLSSHVPRETPAAASRRNERSIRTAPPTSTPRVAQRRSPASENWFSAEGLVALTEAQIELQQEREEITRLRRLSFAVGITICVLVVLLAVPLSFLLYQAMVAWRSPPVPAPVSLDEALPEPAPVLEAAPEPVPVPAAEPEPIVEAPSPAVAPSPRARARALVDQGWSLVGRDPNAAASRFQDALALDPGSADANYGVGYSLLKQGEPDGARPWLCTALRTGDLEVQRDVQSLLDSNSLSCR
jgi:hypothetical protein